MENLLTALRGTGTTDNFFTPHGFCLSWDPNVITLTILGNLVTGLAYLWIPAQLIFLYWKYPNSQWSVGQHKMVWLVFSLFIAFCGLHHFWNVIILFKPWYYTMAFLDMATGIVSILSASVLQIAVKVQPPVEYAAE